jgi:phage terminase large subunit
MADPASPVLAAKVRNLFFDECNNWIPSSYKVMHGGRGGLKSWGFASVAVMLASVRKIRFLCARELQNSIRESVHKTLCTQIDRLGLNAYFKILESEIQSVVGSEFIFKGIRHDPLKIKSMEGFDVCWIEEAENITENSWNIVTPTIFRRPRSEIWVSFNPDLEKDPTSQRFIVSPPPQSQARIIQTNWRDNPWLTDEMRADKDRLARVDPDAYQHVWEGGFRTNSAAQVLRGKCSIEHFEPQKDWAGPYFGADWGFSTDPTALVKLWIKGETLYVEKEWWGLAVELNHLPAKFETIPGSKAHVIRADSARPETISYLKHHGYPRITAAHKGPGSVEDGVEHLRSYDRIVLHPDCPHAIEESRLWSYKVDKLTGDVLPDLLDKHNHCWDAARYALEPLIKRRSSKITPLRM